MFRVVGKLSNSRFIRVVGMLSNSWFIRVVGMLSNSWFSKLGMISITNMLFGICFDGSASNSNVRFSIETCNRLDLSLTLLKNCIRVLWGLKRV